MPLFTDRQAKLLESFHCKETTLETLVRVICSLAARNYERSIRGCSYTAEDARGTFNRSGCEGTLISVKLSRMLSVS